MPDLPPDLWAVLDTAKSLPTWADDPAQAISDACLSRCAGDVGKADELYELLIDHLDAEIATAS